jgi:trans-aconitate 2-methyltransferase
MVFTAGRDIAAGEECCISYFDMTQYVSLSERRAHLSGLFRFKCGCPRCTEEDMNVDGNVEGGEDGMGWGGVGMASWGLSEF